MPKENMHEKANRLINEKSPYLLQHEYNPVGLVSMDRRSLYQSKGRR